VLLKAAEQERKAQEIATGNAPEHFSKGFRTSAAKRQKLEEEEKRQARELEEEMARHAAIIAGGASPDAPGAHDEALQKRKKDGWGGDYVRHKGYVLGGWRALAEKSKALARNAASSSSPPPLSASSSTSLPMVKTGVKTARTHALVHSRVRAHGAASAVGGGVGGRRGGSREKRKPRRMEKGGGESWETEIRADSLPIVCGLPLLAEVTRFHQSAPHSIYYANSITYIYMCVCVCVCVCVEREREGGRDVWDCLSWQRPHFRKGSPCICMEGDFT
jgi:hypothetical protein